MTFEWRRPWWFLEDNRTWQEQVLVMKPMPGGSRAMAWELEGTPLVVRVTSSTGELFATELAGTGCMDVTPGEGEHRLRFRFPHGSGRGRLDWSPETTCG